MTPSLPSPTLGARLNTLFHAALFVLGFSLMFVLVFGGATTLLGQLLYDYKNWLSLLGGLTVIVLGLAMLRVINIPWLYYDTRPQWQGQNQQASWLASLLMGVFFAAGWTPCIGPTLGAILTLGASQADAGRTMLLTSGYAMGLGIPFLLIGFVMDRAGAWVKQMRRYLPIIEKFNGVFLIIIGVLVLTGRMNLFAQWASSQTALNVENVLQGASLSFFIAVLGGLLSFLSPCVLPLVPAYISYLGGHMLQKAARQEATPAPKV